jgi:hypothetical protein
MPTRDEVKSIVDQLPEALLVHAGLYSKPYSILGRDGPNSVHATTRAKLSEFG